MKEENELYILKDLKEVEEFKGLGLRRDNEELRDIREMWIGGEEWSFGGWYERYFEREKIREGSGRSESNKWKR